MHRRAFPAIVGVSVALLVAAMVFLVLGVSRYLPEGTGASLFGPSSPPDIPSAAQTAAVTQSGAAPVHYLSASEVETAWQQVTQAAEEGKWQTWGEVVDADTGEVLLSSGSSGLHTPASTQKVLTAFYSLALLEPDRTWKTGVSQSGSVLYLWGEGDLLLSAGSGDAEAINGRAGLADLAQQVALALQEEGVAAVELRYQDTLFSGTKRNPAWVTQEVSDYAGDVGPYAIDTGRVYPDAWEFVADSSLGVAEALSANLREQGIQVTSVAVGSVPEGAQEIGVVESAPVIDQIEFLLETSDNTMAEQYCHLATATAEEADFSSSPEALQRFLVEAGLPAQDVVIADCSGLDSRSRISGDLLTQTILASATYEDARGSLVRLLPVAGMSGTLSSRLEGESTAGNVEAKTGSLGHVTTLAGVLTTQSGQNLAFAVGNDEVPDDAAYWTRDYLDQFIEFLANS